MAQIEVDDVTGEQLAKLAEATGRLPHELLRDALGRLDLIYVGTPASAPEDLTGPFRKLFSNNPAQVVVRQKDASRFVLREPIRYEADGRSFVVPMDDVSNFASVPRFLTWLIPRYGRHSMAALLHDHLQRHLRKGSDPEVEGTVTWDEADVIFRDAMRDTRVPLVRRWLMWAAVSLRSVFHSGPLGKVAVVGWVAVFAALGLGWPLGLLSIAVRGRFGEMISDGLAPAVERLFGPAAGTFVVEWSALILMLAALVLPVLLSPLLLGRWRLGLISGLGLALVAFPALLAVIFGAGYLAVEWLAERVQPEPAPVIVLPPARNRAVSPAVGVAEVAPPRGAAEAA
jgi:hypothetical protein